MPDIRDRDQSSSTGAQGEDLSVNTDGRGEEDPSTSGQSRSPPRRQGFRVSYTWGWEDTWEMDGGVGPSVGRVEERFHGRVGGMSVLDLQQLYENKLQLLRTKRSATAPTLTSEDKFALLLELCTGDAYDIVQDKFRDRLKANAKDRDEVEAKNRATEERLAASWHAAAEAAAETAAAAVAAAVVPAGEEGPAPAPVPALPPPVATNWPRLIPKGDPTLMEDAWAFLFQTYPEQTARSLSDYLVFGYVPSRTTNSTFHILRELCRKNKKPVEGREVTEKALKALRPEVRRALEDDVLKWDVALCTLDHLERDARQVEDALHTRDLERAQQVVVKNVSTKVQELTVARTLPRQAEGGRQRQGRGKEKGKGKQAYAVTAAPGRSSGGTFPGTCNNCGIYGHKAADCKAKPKGKTGASRKPGAFCTFCKRKDSHDEKECWQAHPELRPDSWKTGGNPPSLPTQQRRWMTTTIVGGPVLTRSPLGALRTPWGSRYYWTYGASPGLRRSPRRCEQAPRRSGRQNQLQERAARPNDCVHGRKKTA